MTGQTFMASLTGTTHDRRDTDGSHNIQKPFHLDTVYCPRRIFAFSDHQSLKYYNGYLPPYR
jgi:hypothetical protein